MIKFLSDKYYYLLGLTIILFVFNGTFRDGLISWIFNSSADEPVYNANTYSKETLLRNIFVYAGYVSFAIIFISSILLLFSRPGESQINRAVLILVPSLILLFILILTLVFGTGHL